MKKTSTLLKALGLIIPFGLLSTSQLNAQGSTCQTAIEIQGTGTFTSDGPADGSGCYNCSGSTNADWYYFTAPKYGTIDIAACGRGLNAADSRLWVYSGDCGNLTDVAANDDACGLLGGYAAAVYNIPVEFGVTYYFEWDDRWDTDAFEFDFTYNPECNNPTNVDFSLVTNVSFVVDWQSSNPGVEFILEYGPLGFIPGNGIEIDGTVGEDNPVEIDGLNPGTTYSVYIQEICGGNTETANVGPFSQTTKFTAPPANDLCSGASPVLCGQTYTGSIVNATETDNPTGECGTSSTDPGVWFSVAGNGDRIKLSLCGSNYNTRMMVFEGSCGNYTCVAGNNNSSDCTLNRSKLAFNSQSNTSYLVFVSGSNGAVGNYSLEVTCEDACTVPVNDVCASAQQLVLGEQGACNTVQGTNECANLATNASDCEPSLGMADVWYTFNTGDATSVEFTVTLQTASAMKFAMYETCGGSEIACGNVNLLTAETIEELTVNTDYLLQIWNGGGVDAGTFEICVAEPFGSNVDENTAVENVISVFPNPTSGNDITITGLGEKLISVATLDGKIALEASMVDEGTLDVSALEKGVYLMTIIQGNTSELVRFVKQ